MKIKLSAGHKVLKPEQEILKKVVAKLKANHNKNESNIVTQTILFQDSKLIIKSTIDGDKVLCLTKTGHPYLYSQVDCFLIDEVLDFEELINKIYYTTTNILLKINLVDEYKYIINNSNTSGFLLEKAEWN